MKNTIFTLAITTFVATTVFLACKPATKAEVVATENVKNANKELINIKKEALPKNGKLSKNQEILLLMKMIFELQN